MVLAAPGLLTVMVLAPQVEVRAPSCSAESAVPLPVNVKLPVARFTVRVVPPMRVVAVPVSSRLSRPLFCTVIFPPVAVRAPDPLMLNVPPLMVGAAVEVEAPRRFRVPDPILVRLGVFGL